MVSNVALTEDDSCWCSGGGLRQLARLLVCNFRAMEHGYEDADSVLRNLRSLPIIPLADGRVVALSEEGVFFPMEEGQTSKKKSPSQTGKSERTGCCALCLLVSGGYSVLDHAHHFCFCNNDFFLMKLKKMT